MDVVGGDMNNDGQINLFDFVELDTRFGLVIDPAIDPNGDGAVTLFDYVVLVQGFGAKSDKSDSLVFPPIFRTTLM